MDPKKGVRLTHLKTRSLQLSHPSSRTQKHPESFPESTSKAFSTQHLSDRPSPLKIHHHEPPKIPEPCHQTHQATTFPSHPKSRPKTSHTPHSPLQTLGSLFCPKTSNLHNFFHTQWNPLPFPPTHSPDNHLAARTLGSAWNAAQRRIHLSLHRRSSAEPDLAPGCRTRSRLLRHLPWTSGDAPEPPSH